MCDLYFLFRHSNWSNIRPNSINFSAIFILYATTVDIWKISLSCMSALHNEIAILFNGVQSDFTDNIASLSNVSLI